jgi:hypothetical protein
LVDIKIPLNSGGGCPFSGGLGQLWMQETAHVTQRFYTSVTVFLVFIQVIKLFVAEANEYYNQYLI